MSGLCEFVVSSRSKRGVSLRCGAKGVPYVILGGLGSTTETLCPKHMEIMATHGYGIEERNSTMGAVAYPQRSTPESRLEGTEELPLFDLPKER
jgi:hypothetical protein